MTVTINDDLAGRELCANELDAVSAGFFGLGSILGGIVGGTVGGLLTHGGHGGGHGPHQPLPFSLRDIPIILPPIGFL
jgi:hypothetical protein